MKELRLRIWVSSAKEGKKQERKNPKKQHKTRKWAKAKIGLVNELPWCMSINKRTMDKSFERK
jgi:hypothetical protein